MKKFFLLFLLAAFTAGQCLAYDFYDETLYYTILDGTTNVQVDGLPSGSKVTTVTIPATVTDGGTTYNVTQINDAAFHDKTTITELDLSKATNLTSIGVSAFNGCTALKTIDMSNATALTIIYANAFKGCTALKTIDMSNAKALTTIGAYSFGGCTGLTSITIPEKVTTQNDAFKDCTNLTDVTFLTSTVGNWFQSNKTIKKVTFGSSVISIAENAFNGNSSITTVDMSGATALTTIGPSAFLGCSALTTVDMSGATALTTIGNGAFNSCKKLSSITIPEKVTTIGQHAFDNCIALTSVDMSKATALTTISQNAFDGCSALTTVEMSGATALTTIGQYAFNCCGKLSSITIPEKVTTIDAYAFNTCSALTSVDMSKATALETIGGTVFSSCSALSTITLPSSLKTIGDGALRDKKLTSITIPEKVEKIDQYAFFGCSALTTVDMSGATALTTIDQYAFFGCSALTTVDMSGATALTTIGDQAFRSCGNLKTVLLAPMGTVPTLGGDVFYQTSADLKFYVKDGAGTYGLTTYTNNANWSSYAKTSNTFYYLPKTVTAAKIATLYLPYEVAIPSGVTAYYCSGTETGKLMLTSLDGGVIPANTPVVIKSDAGAFNFLGNGGITAIPDGINFTLLGTSIDKAVPANSYYTLGKRIESPNDYGFFLYTGTKIAANTCYVDYSSGNGAKGIDLNFDNESTAINDITNSSSSAADVNAPKVIYDLTGRRVNAPQRGSLYIVNGKKVIF